MAADRVQTLGPTEGGGLFSGLVFIGRPPRYEHVFFLINLK